MKACAVNCPGIGFSSVVLMPRRRSRSIYGPLSSPTVAITIGASPKSCRLYAMFPAVPPNSRRICGVRKQTLRMCSWSASRWLRKRSGNTMIVS